MKYYIYVSDTKVDMLYAQIPQSFLSKISVELKIDAKILSTTFKRPSSEENRYSKLEILSRYIQENEKVGTSDFHDNYIQDRLPMRWMSHGNLVYFSGAGNKSIIGLAGSSRNVLGFIETKYEGHDVSLPSSSPLDVLNRLAEIFDAEDKKIMMKEIMV